jgi:hypothetical protein
MSKVSIATVAEAAVVATPPGFSGQAETRALHDGDQDPIHSHLHRLTAGAQMTVGPMAADCSVYVWTGAVEAGGQRMTAGSSLVVERGGSIEIHGGDGVSQLMTFHASRPSAHASAGGHVHLLPNERVPRAEMGAPGVIGGMHANAACPTCEVWLHENSMPARDYTPEDMARGIHSHSEDEVIFITGGEMRFGTQVLPPGAALAISANAFYGFGVGPKGLSFVNFRAGRPSEIRFKGGGTMDEVALWRDSVGAPAYLEPQPAG